MLFDLPEFDYLKKLAEEDPEELDFLCHFYSRRLIDNAPEKYHNRLNGLLFQIEVSRRKSNNPLHSCINLSKMMMESFEELTTALAKVTELNDSEGTVKKEIITDNILQFNR